MPPALRNQRTPTAGDTLASTAASSLERPEAIAVQNCLQFSRCASGSRPGDLKAARTHRSERRLYLCIATSFARVLRRSVESAQYASTAYRQKLAESDIAISMSRPGNPFDNAKAESFMKTLKTEEINGKAFADIGMPAVASMASSQRSTTRTGCTRRSDINRPLSSKPRSRKTKYDNASWQPHCHRNYRVSFQGCSPVH